MGYYKYEDVGNLNMLGSFCLGSFDLGRFCLLLGSELDGGLKIRRAIVTLRLLHR
jgi:hypothetical protein